MIINSSITHTTYTYEIRTSSMEDIKRNTYSKKLKVILATNEKTSIFIVEGSEASFRLADNLF
ncbi:MAG: hypothetical protein HA495_08125 [Thaumarchaeota archaeon]|nr:hypothetical protein [Nitrososphaerota archaeon]